MAKKDFNKYKRLLKVLLELEAKSDKIKEEILKLEEEMDESFYSMTNEEQEEIEQTLKDLREEYGI